MARRYSGQIRIYMNYYDWHQAWLCSVVTPESRWGGWVRQPTMLEHAVDSPPAFDQVAHSALSFAADDDEPIETYAEVDPDGAGWVIKRASQLKEAS